MSGRFPDGALNVPPTSVQGAAPTPRVVVMKQ
jgi:hypothetical protein